MRPRPNAAAIVAAIGLLYVTWLGAHWLRLSYSSGELPIYTSRVWDVGRELARSHRVPWWTSTFQDGSSDAFVYATASWLAPWALLARGLGLVAAGKVLTLASIAAAGAAMFFCARRLLRSERAAALAAFAYLFHPQILARSGGVEHLAVVMFVPLVPAAWLALSRALDRGRFADVFLCAASIDAMVWTQSKQAFVQLVFLAAFAAWSIARAPGRRADVARTLAAIAAVAAPMAAFLVVPVLSELRLLKLFEGDPLVGWQRMYALADAGALLDRRAAQLDYAGVVAIAAAAIAVLYGRARRDRGLLRLVVALEAAAIALGHGRSSVAAALWRAAESRAFGLPQALFVLGFAAALVELARLRVRAPRARLAAAAACAAFLFVPWFRLIALVPLYSDVRAPSVFFEVPGMFFGALLAGFFVTDVVEPGRLAPRATLVVAAVAALFLADAWPYERWMTACDVPAATLDGARAMYAALGREAAREPGGGKVYVVGSRFFHVMGPSWGGPPLVTEGGLTYMAPRGTGRLAAAARDTLSMQRAYLDLVGARWLVFDKSDPASRAPGLQAQLAAYRKIYPLDREDGDFAVFRVPHARAYVSGWSRAALAYGDARVMPELALSLAHDGYLLVSADGGRPSVPAGFDAVYLAEPAPAPPPEIDARAIAIPPGATSVALPPRLPREDALDGVTVARPADDRIDARFTASRGCVAVVGESDYPFWRATLDGRPAPILRVAYGLMGIAVSPGPHEVALRYEPPRSYAWSAAASAASFVVMGIAALFSSRRRRPAEGPAAL